MVSATIIGNVGSDPEIRTTSNGVKITEIRVASNDGKDKTSWWTCKFLGNKAGDTVAQYAKKGSQVAVVGTLDEEKWESNGEKKSKIVMLGASFSFIGSAGKSGDSKSDPPKPAPKQQAQEEEGSDGVPF